jgi:sugar/nucleoside kinase (ribokinase family)
MGFNANGLGGSATYFALAAHHFAPVRVLATVGPDFAATFLQAMPEGVDVRGVIASTLPTYRWVAEHDYTTGKTSSETSDQGAYAEFNPVIIDDQRQTPIIFLGSMQPRYQQRVLDQLEHPFVVAGDTMRLYIREQRPTLEPVLERLDYLFLDRAEAMALAEADTVEEAADRLRSRYRLRGLVIKEGPLGATLYRREGTIHVPAVPVDPPTDPTGAGDAVAGGFLGQLAQSQREDDASLRQAMRYAMVMASFTIQRFSVEGLRHLRREAVEERMASMLNQAQAAS